MQEQFKLPNESVFLYKEQKEALLEIRSSIIPLLMRQMWDAGYRPEGVETAEAKKPEKIKNIDLSRVFAEAVTSMYSSCPRKETITIEQLAYKLNELVDAVNILIDRLPD